MNIYVGNLDHGVDDRLLQETFEAHGTVDSARVIMDRDIGRSRGFGFVEMPNQDEATAAMDALNDTELNGRVMNVNEARPKPQRGGGGGGRRGGGGGGFNRRY